MEKASLYTAKKCVTFLAALLFSAVAYCQNADINILKDINLHRNKSLDGTMFVLTNSVYPVSGIIPITELAVGYARHDSALVSRGYTTIAGLGVNFIVTFGLKYAVNRKRPYVTYSFLEPYQHDTDPSFPSGHTSFAFNTATSLFLIFPKWYVAVPAYAWAATIAYTRMDLGMHYPTDLLAGTIVGAGSSLLSYKGNQWIHHHKKKDKLVHY